MIIYIVTKDYQLFHDNEYIVIDSLYIEENAAKQRRTELYKQGYKKAFCFEKVVK